MAAPKFDKNLWFEHLGCTGRHYFLGNPHTVPGRILAWCPEEKRSLFVSLSSIKAMSKVSSYWVQGYLHGNEPAPPVGEHEVPDFDSSEYKRWRRKTANFRRNGKWVT